jgi:hypothetical protein
MTLESRISTPQYRHILMESYFIFRRLQKSIEIIRRPSYLRVLASQPCTDARVNLNDATVPVVTSILWLVASYLVSNFEGFERVRARDAREQFCQFLLIASESLENELQSPEELRIVGPSAPNLYVSLCKVFRIQRWHQRWPIFFGSDSGCRL